MRSDDLRHLRLTSLYNIDYIATQSEVSAHSIHTYELFRKYATKVGYAGKVV